MDSKCLKKLQNTELDILCEVDRVCKKNNINYFIMYGTLLGAVRHEGFIPWDDDIDIAMPREDYERFLDIIGSELKDKYILDFVTVNKDYYLPFAKIKNKNTLFQEKNAVNYKGNKGIWIDIFPYDDYKTNKKGLVFKIKFKFILFLHTLMIKNTLNLDLGKHNLVFKFISKFITNPHALRLIEKMSKSKKNADYMLYYSVVGASQTPIFKKSDIFPLKEIKFCNKKFYAPKNYKKVLVQLYGNDYMKLPPVEKRVTHNPIKIVFEDGEIVEFNEEKGVV